MEFQDLVGSSSLPPQSPSVIPGFGKVVENFKDSGEPALTLSRRLIFARASTSGDDGADVRIHRSADYRGESPWRGFVNSALTVTTNVSPGAASFEWSGNFILDNSGTSDDGSENVALAWSAIKRSTGRTLAGFGQITDLSGANPRATSVVTEFDIYSNGADDNEQRIFLDLQNYAASVEKGGDGAPGVASHGVRAFSADGSPIINGFTAANGVYHCFHGAGTAVGGVLLDDVGKRAIGVNLSGGVYSTVAMALGRGQAIAFDFGDGVYRRSLSVKPGGQLAWTTPKGDAVLISDDGQIQTKGNVTVPFGAKIGLDAAIGAPPSRYLSVVGTSLTYTTTKGHVFSIDDSGNTSCANDFTSRAKISCAVIRPKHDGDPASPVEGDLWYNSVTNTFRCFMNGAIRTILSV